MSKKKHNILIRYLPVFGCISTGLIYLGIGVVAILSFLKIKQGGADEGSLLAFLNSFLVGKILTGAILIGTIVILSGEFLKLSKILIDMEMTQKE